MRLPLSLRYSLSPRLLSLLGLEPESDIGPGIGPGLGPGLGQGLGPGSGTGSGIGPGIGPGLGPGSGPAGDVILEGCGVTCESLSSSFDVDRKQQEKAIAVVFRFACRSAAVGKEEVAVADNVRGRSRSARRNGSTHLLHDARNSTEPNARISTVCTVVVSQ